MIDRRRLLAVAASAPAIAAFPQIAAAHLPNLSGLRTRNIASGAIEVIYKTPHAKPNGLDVTGEGMWIMDQGPENYASLINPQDGKLIREFVCEGVRAASGGTGRQVADLDRRRARRERISCTSSFCS